MKHCALELLLVFIVVSSTTAIAKQRRTLVVLDELSRKENFSQYFNSLQERNHELYFCTPEDETVALQKFGEYFYANIIIFSPSTRHFAAFDKTTLLEFVEHGGNVLVASGLHFSKALQEIAALSGIEFHTKENVIMDHFNYNYNSSYINHDSFYTHNFIKSTNVVGDKLAHATDKSYVVFKGSSFKISQQNRLAFSVLSPPPTAHIGISGMSLNNSFMEHGSQVTLVSAVQARNNARLVFSGSLEIFSNKFFEMEIVDRTGVNKGKSANKEFCLALSFWAFNDVGVLRVRNVYHSREDGSKPATMLGSKQNLDSPASLYPYAEVDRSSLAYRVKDSLTFSFQLDVFNNDMWRPYNNSDVQMEFVMLDAYLRRNMTHNNKGRFSLTFQSPDNYGIFKFRVMHRRPGYSSIHISNQISLRPFKHDEYERFVVTAFPYYASVYSMMVGLLLSCILFLYLDSSW